MTPHIIDTEHKKIVGIWLDIASFSRLATHSISHDEAWELSQGNTDAYDKILTHDDVDGEITALHMYDAQGNAVIFHHAAQHTGE